MGNGPQEPNAESRIGAANLRQIYLALTAEGFTEEQTLTILSSMMIAGAIGKWQHD